jgi:hypothetical protein
MAPRCTVIANRVVLRAALRQWIALHVYGWCDRIACVCMQTPLQHRCLEWRQ